MKKSKKTANKIARHPDFKLPASPTIHGRSSTMTSAFFVSITPVKNPTHEEVSEALKILGMSPGSCACAYCGGKKSEWDHLRPTIDARKPTGYITEIANLVPACGKCNQSKGNKPWKEWMRSAAPHSPQTRNIPDLEQRIARLEAYEKWKTPIRLDYEKMLGEVLWSKHLQNWSMLLESMKEAQQHALVLKTTIEKHLKADGS